MSPRRNVLKFAGIIAALALLGALFAGPASAKRMTAKQKAHVRAELRKQIKKNPKAIQKKSFLKKASLVSFKLPVTVRLRDSSLATNPNSATIDLGASLGQRKIGLGGTLPAEISFKDSFDGGALGNVDLDLLPPNVGGVGGLTSTSIPLLWNPDTSTVPYTGAGCSGWNAVAPPGIVGFDDLLSTPTGPVNNVAPFDGSVLGTPGYPRIPGVDGINLITASNAVGSPYNLGDAVNPFPTGDSPLPGAPSVTDTVLRTGPLTLTVAEPGTAVNQENGTGPNGSQNITIGKSGGQANLFGDIPGKDHGIDVTVSLATKINSILRAVDTDVRPLVLGASWPAYAFNCRQAWTGAVQNYIAGVRLVGDLKIAPAITPDGKLRIAKATLNSVGQADTRVALAACLAPYSTFAASASTSGPPFGPGPDTDVTPVTVPTPPINPGLPRAAPTAGCNDDPVRLVKDAINPDILQPAAAANGFTTTADGSKVSVAGDLSVQNVSADVLIGDQLP